MRNRRLIRFVAAGSPRMEQFRAMQRGRAHPSVTLIKWPSHWLRSIGLSGPGRTVRS